MGITRGMSPGSVSKMVSRPFSSRAGGHQTGGLVIKPQPGRVGRADRGAVYRDPVAFGSDIQRGAVDHHLPFTATRPDAIIRVRLAARGDVRPG